jgi:glycolate oxidase
MLVATMPISRDLANEVREIVGHECYLDSPAETASYGFNSYPMFTEPAAVVLFQAKEQVQQVMSRLYARDVPMVIRGSGTNIGGSALAPKGGVVLSMERMTRILELDVASRYVRVEAGANVKAVQELARANGLLFPPNPGNVDAITVGGIVGCNSAGDLALGYGATREYVLGLEVVLGDGTILKLGSRVRKDVTGYDLVRVMVGSEGTLGAIVEATLRFVDQPEAEASVIAAFRTQDAGAEETLHVMDSRLQPVALEYMDQRTTRAVEQAFHVGFPDAAESTLLVKFHGNRESVNHSAQRCAELFRAHDAIWTEHAQADEPADHLWRARHLAYPALARICPTIYAEDVVVPLRHFAAAVRRIHELSQETGVPIALFGHAGDGHLHPIIMTNDSDPEQRARSDQFVEKVILLALDMGGTITGEHGIGVHKTRFVHHQYGPAERAVMLGVKHVFDPKGLINPMIFPVTGHEPKPGRRKGVHTL